MTTQALVIAHASYGHNSFFKGNHLFRQWTAADAILDYLVFARRYVMECEERHGADGGRGGARRLPRADAARRRPLSPARAADAEGRGGAARRARSASRAAVQRPVAHAARDRRRRRRRDDGKGFPAEPQENILYFVEKYSPKLEPWQRELVRIVRKLAQYFYPQAQTKVMNEGWATFWHYTILNRLHEQGQVDDGFMLEFLKSHTNVVAQPAFDSQAYGGLNPYALGFAMFSRPAAHLREAGRRGPRVVPAARRQRLADDARLRDAQLQGRIVHRAVPVAAADPRVPPVRHRRPRGRGRRSHVDSIHDEHGYRRVRKLLAQQHAQEIRVPDVQVVRYDRDGDRSLTLRHMRRRGRPLTEAAAEVVAHLRRLWGFTVRLETWENDIRVGDVVECAA